MHPESPFLTLSEAAAYARCSKRTIQRRIKSGELRSHGLGVRPLIRQEDLDTLLSSSKGALT